MEFLFNAAFKKNHVKWNLFLTSFFALGEKETVGYGTCCIYVFMYLLAEPTTQLHNHKTQNMRCYTSQHQVSGTAQPMEH
jgi:hypothetical protein